MPIEGYWWGAGWYDIGGEKLGWGAGWYTNTQPYPFNGHLYKAPKTGSLQMHFPAVKIQIVTSLYILFIHLIFMYKYNPKKTMTTVNLRNSFHMQEFTGGIVSWSY